MSLRWSRPRYIAQCFATYRTILSDQTFSNSQPSHPQARPASTTAPIETTRNIGIIAHIDAGKTTTTERMLYYSGFTRRLGDVDEGSTVTDFLPAERARGITIQSAAVSFSWPPTSESQSLPAQLASGSPRSSISHNINLIDTPGHADFTFEVLRSLRVLDGAVCILDSVAGVEAQTEKVWAQATSYRIPRILFVNKLDREGAAFGRTVREVALRLATRPAVCGIPWWTSEGKLQGVGDVVGLRGLRYVEGGDGKQIEVDSLQQLEIKDTIIAEELKRARVALVELLSDHDDIMVEKYLESDANHLAITPADITASLRRSVLMPEQIIVPVFAGASFRNVGVQPLLDAIVDLLPSPNQRSDPEISLEHNTRIGLADFLAGKLITNNIAQPGKSATAMSKDKATYALRSVETCALAFKVVADAKRGVLVYIRVYSGSVNRNTPLWNTNLQISERAQRLLRMYANDAVDIESIPAGQIGVVPGLKFARTGDTLISYTGANPKNGPPSPINTIQLKPIDVPPPVFTVSVEPNSLAEEKHMKESLDLLLREDPSLHMTLDEESGQTHLSGMGELHLEIARDRLIQDLKAKTRIGSIEIGYREALTTASAEVTEVSDREISGKSSKAACSASVAPVIKDLPTEAVHDFALADNNRLSVRTPTLHNDGTPVSDESPKLPENLPLPSVLQGFQNAAAAALARGPTHRYPIHSAHISITFDPTQHVFHNTTVASLSSAARMAVRQALRQSAERSATVLMEPVMQVTISADEDSLGSVVHDISSARGGSVISLGSDDSTSPEKRTTIDASKIYAPPDPFAGAHAIVDVNATGGIATRHIVARVPLKEMIGYLKHLRSLTGGRGTFTMVVDRFEKMSTQRQRAVSSELRGD